MSRAALWRQEGNVKERQRRAEELFEQAVEDGRQRSRARGVVPLWGNDSSFHINPLLLRNTIHSPYFQKCCEKLKDWNSLIDEIYYEVKSLQPFAVDKAPSTAFCLLLRLLTLRMTHQQLEDTLKHADSPYIRGIGFLYLRYAGPPESILQFIEPYLWDAEELTVQAGHRPPTTTIGVFVRQLFGSSRDFYGTPLPRFPVPVERAIQVRILQAEQIADRAALHYKNQQRMSYFQTLGSQVMALYGDDENPITWYKAVVDRVITRDEASGYPLKYPKFVVTFTEYGNTETVLLGEMDVLEGSWRHEDPQAPRGQQDLYKQIQQRERNAVTADKGWARRPPSTKNALQGGGGGQGPRRSVQDDDYPRRQHRHNDYPGNNRHDNTASQQSTHRPPPQESQAKKEPPKKRSAEEMAMIQEKKRKLMAKYG